MRLGFARHGFSTPLQLLHGRVARPLHLEDIRHLSAEAQREYLSQWFAAEKKRRFAWEEAPLFRVTLHRRTDDTCQLTLTEVTLDGWSIAVLLAELCRSYRALRRHERLGGEPVPDPPFGRFVQLEREAAQDGASAAFWQRAVTPDRAGALPRWPARWRSADASLHSRRSVSIAPDLVAGLRSRAREAGVSLKSVCLAAHFAVLRVLTGRDDVLTALITHGRPEETGSDLAVGLYTNTVPAQLSLSGMRWNDVMRAAHQLETDIYPHRRYPFAEIHRRSRHPRLQDSAFNFTHFHVYADLLDGGPDLEVLGVEAFDQTYFTLTAYFNVQPREDRLVIDLDYNPTSLAHEQMVQVASYYETALHHIIASPGAMLAATPLVSAAERAREIDAWAVAPASARLSIARLSIARRSNARRSNARRSIATGRA